jgi:hypothetical protein
LSGAHADQRAVSKTAASVALTGNVLKNHLELELGMEDRQAEGL